MSQLPIPPFIQTDLARVDHVILERIEVQAAVIRAASEQLLTGHGPRLRAALTLLSAQLGRYAAERVLHAAAAVELIHAATSIHNNLIDSSERRRGVAADHSRWNGDVPLMVGDYLLALAASEMALAPDPRIIAYFSRAVMSICEGELAPVMVAGPLDEARNQYMYTIGGTVAALFEAGCKAGMVCGDGSQEQIDAAGRFGYDFGLAYQIMGDVRSLSGEQGERAGGWFRAGAIALPLIYALDQGADERLVALLDQDTRNEEETAWALAEIRRAGGDARALEDARQIAGRALAQLASFPASPATEALEQMVRHVTER